MAYKIYTYADPYRIRETDFWNGNVDHIKDYPQLCASRTLVNGLISVMREDIESLICPIDDIVNEKIFRTWTNDIGVRILQYSELSAVYRRWNQNKKLSDDLYIALTHNKDEMLDSLRLFIELGIDSSSLKTDGLSMEHRLFAYMLKITENERLFKLPKMPNLPEIISMLKKQAEDEKVEKETIRNEYKDTDDSKLWKQEEKLLDRMIESTNHWDGKHIVIHGIHQFTPLQLRFITHLDKLGVEVIFVHNYVPEFKEIYSSWTYIYQQFNTPIHHDRNVGSYVPIGQFKRPGNAIASNFGLLCEETVSRTDKRMRDNYDLYKDVRVQEFDNISEYAGYISDEFMEAEASMSDTMSLSEKPFKKNAGTAAILRKMQEVVYTANKDVDDLLQVYHPEYARNRHFLAYPVGQFFTALYAMWDPDTQSLGLDYDFLRECVNSGILSKYSAEALLKTLMNVQPLFEHVETVEDFDRIIGKKYKNAYSQVSSSNQGSIAFSLKAMNIYNTYKITANDFDNLYKAICEINEIAKKLFTGTTEDKINFKKHFERLEEFVRERQDTLVSEEEKTLITQLLTKLDIIQMKKKEDEYEGTFEDLRKGLYFFLKQKEEPVSDWFVKNFEQIDGDVLNSKAQNKPGFKKVYHFACVSDADMNKDIDDLLPWPLSEMFIERAYNPKELLFQVYYAALGEKSNFLRYALFYGLYFNQCESKISFVKRYGDNTTDLYEMLKLIGVEKADGPDGERMGDCDNVIRIEFGTEPIISMTYAPEQMADMFLCPYRYLFDFVLNPQPIFSGKFLFQKLYENLLIKSVWQQLDNEPMNDAKRVLSSVVGAESKKMRPYFPFFRETEILDLERRAENYVVHSIFRDGDTKVHKCDRTHMQLRENFGNALFAENGQDYPKSHPYKTFENITRWEDGKKIYGLHDIPILEKKELIEATLQYLNDTDENMAHAGSWCVFCPNKGICLESYVVENK
ncbi:hypothetical protein J5A74_00605 [Lachnospiraceae bacterium oral taxon 096]|nr:hypothetical protein J5A74_00605 [Lachnospiraceae bacterium oral taxon 096]